MQETLTLRRLGTYPSFAMRSIFRFAIGALLAWSVAGSRVHADDDDLRLMNEPASYTNVSDAFDEDDPFDLNLSFGFVRTQTVGTVEREGGAGASDGRSSQHWYDVADTELLRNSLVLGLELGIWHDLMAYARVPIVLSETRKLKLPAGRSSAAVNADLCTPTPSSDAGTALTCDSNDDGELDGQQLFSVPFEGPKRSGIGALDLGLAWSISNQHRDRHFPTWTLILGARVDVGSAMNPCSVDGGCSGSEDQPEPGISEGVHGFHAETRASYRYRYIEPYAGLSFDIFWPSNEGDDFFAPSGDLEGYMNTLPPRIGEVTAGVAVIPWEHRGRWQRLSLDLRLQAAYVSEGHGRSALYDALGTSTSDYLAISNSENANNDPDASAGREIAFNGLTDMQAHGRIGGRFAIEMQAARYVSFFVASSVYYSTPYIITFSDACNPAITPDGEDDPRIGECRRGIINPHHRPAIDLPGRRFRMDDELEVNIEASAVAQF